MKHGHKMKKAYKILLLGGHGVGKSTLLSSIYTQCKGNTPEEVCSILDKTCYINNQRLLSSKHDEIKRFLNNRLRTEFCVRGGDSFGIDSYIIEVKARNACLSLEFIDVPGSFMRVSGLEYAKYIVRLVREANVFIITIDTPYLMNAKDKEGVEINEIYNRIDEIIYAMRDLNVEYDNDLKQIFLCPVKCEKWMQEGKIYDVVDNVKSAFKYLINHWRASQNVVMQIMPIQTVGGIEFTRMLPAMRYFSDEKDSIGTLCSECPSTGLLVMKDGRVMRRRPGDCIEPDISFVVDNISLPLSWYKFNGKDFCPKFGEQVIYHILNNIVEMESSLNRANPSFEKELSVWRDVISWLKKMHLIKTEGDGFCYIH